ncbi:MAG: 23S rRNA pseudouridine(955/2504/2580) synthase RluC [Halioglobus sp.]|nr:23S rRNA pseudouridine(955/2504/2580) synthase RluC [Halioglobus sp.]
MSTRPDTPPSGHVRHLEIDENDAGQRLDNYLVREMKGVPRTRLYRALRKGEVRVNKGRVRADYRLQAGDLVRLPPLHQPEPSAPASIPRQQLEQLSRQIIYEDDQLLVIDKPSGLAVHGGSGLSFGLIECLRQLRPEARYLELVHRLDRDTSGVILIAKRAPVLRELHRQLREKHIDKRYLALVAGKWPKAVRVVDAPLEKNVLQSGERMVRVSREGKRAVTEFSVLERLDGATLIEARPVTGRTHQIRVHAQHAGFPLLGDDKYSDDRTEALARQLGLKRLFLHAASLHFSLPDNGEFNLQAPLEKGLESILDKIRR